MKTVVVAWELGGGLGHLVQLHPLVRGLLDTGHRVYLCLRDLAQAKRVFASSGARYLATPAPARPSIMDYPRPDNFAELIWNLGFGREAHLWAMAQAWVNLFDL